MGSDGMSRARLGDLEFAFRSVGSGPPLLMLHGLEGDHRVFEGVQNALMNDIQTIAMDQRDCGATKWISAPCDYTIDAIVEDAIRLIDDLGFDRVHLIGNSAGGIVAQHIAVKYPQKIDRLILGLTFPADSDLASINPEGAARRRAIGEMGEGSNHALAMLMSSPAYFAAHPALTDWMSAVRATHAPGALPRRHQAIREAAGVQPSAITAQTLVIAAQLDAVVPPWVVQKLQDQIPGAVGTTLADVGHLAAIENPSSFAQAVRNFLLA